MRLAWREAACMRVDNVVTCSMLHMQVRVGRAYIELSMVARSLARSIDDLRRRRSPPAIA